MGGGGVGRGLRRGGGGHAAPARTAQCGRTGRVGVEERLARPRVHGAQPDAARSRLDPQRLQRRQRAPRHRGTRARPRPPAFRTLGGWTLVGGYGRSWVGVGSRRRAVFESGAGAMVSWGGPPPFPSWPRGAFRRPRPVWLWGGGGGVCALPSGGCGS